MEIIKYFINLKSKYDSLRVIIKTDKIKKMESIIHHTIMI